MILVVKYFNILFVLEEPDDFSLYVHSETDKGEGLDCELGFGFIEIGLVDAYLNLLLIAVFLGYFENGALVLESKIGDLQLVLDESEQVGRGLLVLIEIGNNF